MDQTPDPAAEHGAEHPPEARRHDVDVRVRRSPKFGVFMVVGAVVGALIGWGVTAFQPPGVDDAGAPVDTTGVLGLVIVVGVVLGLGAGALVALLVDRSLAKRGRVLVAEQTDVEPVEEAPSPADAGEASFEPLPWAAPTAAAGEPTADERGADERSADERSADERRADPLAAPGDDPRERDRPAGA
ncbi:hypothetical protein [Agrococcus baldri]|uniref:Uncharacterized protein n=1 Tax=Agrococcus baldri TaxID=153730 RepID=A0AA87URS7_9MICO|nr:hypothetical protein [Agrococcus baldri]GEK80281.1 hypothetical protein ABA31_16320 [Agrococcus baldri]